VALISSQNSETVCSRHGTSRHNVYSLCTFANDVELPLGTFEYKPELPVSQSPQDIFHKFKFDKLESPTIKRRRLSADSYDHVELANEQPRYQATAVKEDEKEVKYGQAWLMRFVIYMKRKFMVGNVRSFVHDSGRLMSPRI
jgi:hypothetical protein